MTHSNWWKNAIIYQIYPRSFCDSNHDGLGDIPGIISKLDYLKDLGINCVWLSPVYDSPQEDNGYDIKDYQNIWKPFGTMDDFKLLLSEMHKRGIKLIMDLVVNHTSSEHRWFKEAMNNPSSPYRDYYIIKKGKKNGKKPPTNWTGFFGGSTWEKIPHSDEYYLHLFAKGQPDLNWENPSLREEIKNILRFWLDLGVDGFRCDVINLISKKQDFKDGKGGLAIKGHENYINGPRLHEYLNELYNDVYSHYDTMTVGETVFTNLDSALALTNNEHPELDMIFNFDVVDVDDIGGVKYFARKFKLKNLKKIYEKWQLGLKGKSWNTLFLENHDQRRSVGRFNTSEDTYRKESAKMLFTMQMFMEGTPFIYQGQEIGMTNYHFKSLDEIQDVEVHNISKIIKKIPLGNLIVPKKRMIEYSRENARTPMQWDSSEFASFSDVNPWIKVNPNKDYINVKDDLESEDSIYRYFQKIISLRKENMPLLSGSYETLYKKDKKVFAYKRVYNNEEIVVILNFNDKPTKRDFLKQYDNHDLLISNYSSIKEGILSPYEARVYKKSN